MINSNKGDISIMKETLIVRGAPQEYICEVGSWNQLETYLLNRNLKRVLVLTGTKSWEVAKHYFPKLKQVELIFEHYQNECRYDIRDYFKEIVETKQLDGIIAVGGGKVLDLGKLVASEMKIPCICLPTLASTCAAYTPVSIVYNDKHEMIDMLFFSQSISLTLIDPQVLLHSPKDYLVAGIGDTLAKWYESDPILSNMTDLSVEVEIARFAAKSCQKNLLDEGKQAILDLESQTLSPSFIKVIETNIMLAGMVGGFGDKYGRTSGAHSIHDALTHIPETAKQLHGNKVAYGILVQLGFEEKWEEVNQLLPFFTDLGLPISYQELGCTNQDMEKVARLASKDEFMSLLPFEVSEEMIMTSIKRLEAMSL